MPAQRVPFYELEAAGIAGPYIHATGQLRDRYHINIGPRAYLQLCQEISHALPDLEVTPCRCPGRVALWWRLLGRRVRFVFDTRAGLIITALPIWDKPRRSGNLKTENGHVRKAPELRRHRDNRRKYPQQWEEE
ncbi:hypothetical protein [Deinococcus sp. Leaf326]|uniref:hypothetical protein n=1 Tax=Deinococcus sp. Leaf326 TaxID=1736338 RepID=UPI0006F3454C|nr:hypothetical protein [Deinococcus sp. Leaf326]KQR22902.1 hypothetical protein ASF71_06965 [Deinococcus sp. Leaf326]